jgi:6-phosphogluconolactonase/glucosamine-6-phosphate isomerase/deaminase
MVFTKIANADPVVHYLADLLRQKLTGGQKVLWLVAGGSAISVAVAVAEKLQTEDLSNLTVTLTDERYGPMGHKDSNWQQLKDAGLVLGKARAVPVLHGHSIEETTTEFGQHLLEYCQGAAYCVGLFGIGPDGHTAGILPNSSAVNETAWAAYYQGPDFKRVTMTVPAIAALSEAVVYAMGEAKKPALSNLQTDLSVAEQPAQALKKVPTVTIFNDQIGDTE